MIKLITAALAVMALAGCKTLFYDYESHAVCTRDGVNHLQRQAKRAYFNIRDTRDYGRVVSFSDDGGGVFSFKKEWGEEYPTGDWVYTGKVSTWQIRLDDKNCFVEWMD